MTVSNLIFAAAAGDGSKYGGKIITYSIGSGGTSVIYNFPGNAGGNTSATFEGITITGNGGGGASYIQGVGDFTAATGGSYSGGDGGSNGGNGGVLNFTYSSSGSGGAIGNVNGLSGSSRFTGSNGAQSNNSNLSSLQTAIEAAGYSWTSPGQGYSTLVTTSSINASGFGCGGGSVPRNTTTISGGNGYFGGGSGSYSNTYTNDYFNGSGGNGAVVCQFVGLTTTYVVLTSGISYTVPNGTNSVKIWVVGAGGSGSCNIQYNLGKGGAAGGVAWKTWS